MLFSPLSVLIGLASFIYVALNLRLLSGLRNLGRVNSRIPDDLSDSKAELPLVTVLIAARNEEHRISKCLDCLISQDYPAGKLQIIVVDDRSSDGTSAIINEYIAKWPKPSGESSFTGLTMVSIKETSLGSSPKKFALSQGLKQAHGELILTTDADCIMSKTWISAIVSEFKVDTGLVLGMTSYYPMGPPGWVFGTQALEFISYGIVAAGLVGLRFPVHGNANNIAYRRRAYDEAAGFTSHSNIVSGDDDFLIQSIHKLGRWKIQYSVHPDSQVRTEPPLSLRQFWEQRKRWAGKCSLYEPKQAGFLLAIFTYYAFIPICMLLGLYQTHFFWLGLAGWSLKTGSDYLVMRQGLSLFSKKELLRWFPTTCIIHIPLIIGAVLAGSFGEFTWKDQRVKRKL